MIALPKQRPAQLIAIAALGLLAACAQPFEARVQSFQVMPPTQGQSFAIEPSTDARKGSLEFAAYAGVVQTELQRLGFQPAAPGAKPDLVVLMDFGAGPARERVATRPGMWGGGWGGMGWGGWGWGGRGWGPGWGAWGDPFWGPGMGWQADVYSYSVYPKFLEVKIKRAGDQSTLFEGRAEATTRSNDLPSNIANLATALFTDFPGTSARSTVVRVPKTR